MSVKRRRHNPDFKFRVDLEATKVLTIKLRFRSIMIIKELQIQMANDPPYFCHFLVLTLGVTIK